MKKFLLFLAIISYSFSSNYEDWLKEQNKEFIQYKKTIDEEFTDSLRKDWHSFKTMYTPTPYKEKKPIELPIIKNEINIPKKELEKSKKVKLKEIKKEKKEIILKEFKPTEDSLTLNIDFFSTNIKIQYDPKAYFSLNEINNKSISSYWDKINQTKYSHLIEQINQYSIDLQFNDWAKYLLIYKIGFAIYQDNNLSNLFSWFIMSKMQYDVKIGYNDADVYLLSAVKHDLYQVTFFNMKNKRYYVLTPNGRIKKTNNIYTYKGRYPNTNKKLTFEFEKPINILGNQQNRELQFFYNSKKYNINTNYSRNLVDFYKTFPQSQYDIYFKTISNTTATSLLKELSPIIKNKSELEAVNILLRFVQTSFKYKTDLKQFSYEKVFFPEETLFYEYSDCEDRSILFSFLVKELLGLDVVGVKFSNHLATAVAFSSSIKGDSFTFKNRQYTMADPTYINANIGMTMPKYSNERFEIIK